MKKLILLLLIILILPLSATAKVKVMPMGDGDPVYFDYMTDYALLLRDAFKKKKMVRKRDTWADVVYTITRDGEIKDMTCGVNERAYFYVKAREIISSVPPLPFRDGMDFDEIQFGVAFGFSKYATVHLSICTVSEKERFVILILLKK